METGYIFLNFFSMCIGYVLHICVCSNCHKSPKFFPMYSLKKKISCVSVLDSSNLFFPGVNCTFRNIGLDQKPTFQLPYLYLDDNFFETYRIYTSR